MVATAPGFCLHARGSVCDSIDPDGSTGLPKGIDLYLEVCLKMIQLFAFLNLRFSFFHCLHFLNCS